MTESSSVSLKNAVIDTEDMTITEYTKDDNHTYSLIEILKRWNGIDGVTLIIKRNVDKTE